MTASEPRAFPAVHPDSVLFISLDSCRYDTFLAANLPNMKAVGPLHRAQAPSHFTYGSHAAMFVGFTPGVAERAEPFLNPKFARLFRLSRAGHRGIGTPGFTVDGDNIVDGFRNAGLATIGTAAMGWFDPDTPVSEPLLRGFDEFWFAQYAGVEAQIKWARGKVEAVADRRVFLFMNLGETHVPYHHEGADWPKDDNRCRPFGDDNDAQVCRARQTACAEYVDHRIGPLLSRFADATVLLCSDHGDCWGEDGLWEHGVSHEMTLTVPLLIRYRGQPVA